MGNYITSSLLSERLGSVLFDQLVDIFAAEATASLATTAVSSVAVTNRGGGYSSAPTVVFTGGGGANAAATANIVDGHVVSVTVTAGGTGYTSAPAVSFTGGGVSTVVKDAAIANIIERAEGVVDGYLAVVYSTPVPANPMVEELAMVVAERELYKRSSFPSIPEKIKDSYEDALELLKDIATGKMAIPVAGTATSSAGGVMEFEGDDDKYTDDDMAGF
jgi:phage gp36-like protein